MKFSDILSLFFSTLGLYGLVSYLRFLLPRNVLPYVSAVLTEVEHLLDRAESLGVIPRPNDHRSTLASCASEFLQFRAESHRAPRILQQLRLAVRCRLTCKLYALSSRVEAIKIAIELALDERRLTSLTDAQNTIATTLPTLADSTRLTRYDLGNAIIVAAIVMANGVAEPRPLTSTDASS